MLKFGDLKPAPGRRTKSLEPKDVAAVFAALSKQRLIEHVSMDKEMFLTAAIEEMVESMSWKQCVRLATAP